MKIVSAHITLAQIKAMNYLQEIGLHPSVTELMRMAVRSVLYVPIGMPDPEVNAGLDVSTFFKHVPKAIVVALWNENLRDDKCQLHSLNFPVMILGWLDMIATAQQTTRSDIIRVALHDYLQRELIMVELMSRKAVNVVFKKISTTRKANDIDMRRVKRVKRE